MHYLRVLALHGWFVTKLKITKRIIGLFTAEFYKIDIMIWCVKCVYHSLLFYSFFSAFWNFLVQSAAVNNSSSINSYFNKSGVLKMYFLFKIIHAQTLLHLLTKQIFKNISILTYLLILLMLNFFCVLKDYVFTLVNDLWLKPKI